MGFTMAYFAAGLAVYPKKKRFIRRSFSLAIICID
jgi:hypothetical protein